MTNPISIKVNDDESLEWQFVLGYADFAGRMGFEAITAIYERAVTTEDLRVSKSLRLSGMQYLFGSWEDFALLLLAFKRRKTDGLPIHRSLWLKGEKEGSTDVPSVFKNFVSARQMLDELGFTEINQRSLRKYYLGISKGLSKAHYRTFLDPSVLPYRRSISNNQMERIFNSFSDQVRMIGKSQRKFNELKNLLKHGKGVIEGVKGCENSDHVAFLSKTQNEGALELRWVNVSLQRLKRAVAEIAQVYEASLQLLWLFMLQYHREHVEEYRKIYVEQATSCEKRLSLLGITSLVVSANRSMKRKPKRR
jgi:hypothetical protein